MKWTFVVGLVALLASTPAAQAQCLDGSCVGNVIPSAAGHQYGYPAYLGCGGFCFKFLGRLHQEGPLFNYGPYSGYYPFAPYGPWDSNFNYNPPLAGCGAGGPCGLNRDLFGRLGGRGNCASGDCGDAAWGGYAMTTLRGVFHRSHPLANRAQISTGSFAAPASSCGNCGGGASVVAASVVQPVSAETPADPVYGDRVYRER